MEANSPSGGEVSGSGTRFALVTACYLMAVGGLEFCIMPVFLGAMASHLQFSEQQVGFIGSAYLVGFVLTSFSAVFWARRVSWRLGVVLSAIAACAVYALTLLTADYNLVLVLIILVGCSRGVFYAVSVCSLGDGEEAERDFALGTVASMVLAGVSMLLLPAVIEAWKMPGLYLPMILLSAITFLFLRGLPVGASTRAQPAGGPKAGMNLQVFLGLCALMVFWIGMGGIWAFLERIGNANGLSPQAIGTVLGVSYGAVIAVAAGAAWLGDRAGRGVPIYLGIVAMLAGIVVMDRSLTFATYMTASLLFQCGWIFAYPYMMAVINKGDVSGRFVPLIAAVQGLGASVGSGLGGSLLTAQTDYSALYVMGHVTLVASSLVFGWVLILQRNPPARLAPAGE